MPEVTRAAVCTYTLSSQHAILSPLPHSPARRTPWRTSGISGTTNRPKALLESAYLATHTWGAGGLGQKKRGSKRALHHQPSHRCLPAKSSGGWQRQEVVVVAADH